MKNSLESIVDFLRILINTKSQSGIDNTDNILDVIDAWYTANALKGRFLYKDDKKVAYLYEIIRDKSKPTICFNACADTAAIGNIEDWKFNPFDGTIVDNKIYGRGAADSKASISIFSHVAKHLKNSNKLVNVSFLFDADEHSGNFNGIKTFIENTNNLKAVALGYPGNYSITIGSRGFFRCQIKFRGISQHSGSSKPVKSNAIIGANNFITKLMEFNPEDFVDEEFGIPPKVSITEINGGLGFNLIPDTCTLKVDIRLTPLFRTDNAKTLIEQTIKKVENNNTDLKTETKYLESWESFKTADNSKFANGLKSSAEKILSKEVPKFVCGPSNIGNYIAQKGIEVTVGFGVTYENIHAPNECAYIDTIPDIFNTYKDFIVNYFKEKNEA